MKRATAVVAALALLILGALLLRPERRFRKPPVRSTAEATTVELAAEPAPAAASLPPLPPAPAPPPPSRPAPIPPPVTVSELPPMVDPPGTAFIRGAVKVLGQPPPRKRIRMDGDPKCVERSPEAPLSDEVVVDPEGRVRWAFVYVASGINNLVPPTPMPPVLLDQAGCMYDPHVLGVRVGQPLNVFNSDRLLHNVHGLPFENAEFNFGLPQYGQYRTLKFDTPEVMIRLGCDVHPWMRAWVGVLDHPYFSVTNDTGSYGIAKLPAGRYTIKVWHEAYATVSRVVDVPPGGDIVLDFILDAKKR